MPAGGDRGRVRGAAVPGPRFDGRAGAGLPGAPVAAVARICRELDGLPLAIELAAARTSVLSVEEIEAHLGTSSAFLTRRRPVADPRHQALKATIDWSYRLLPAAEQDAFAQLSVFAADFGLEQAAAVCCGGDLAAALDLVDRLASKSLIVAETAGGGPGTGCWTRSASTRPAAWPRRARPSRPGGATPRRSWPWPIGNAT